MLTKNQILNELQMRLDFMKQEFHISSIGLFGSFARNMQKEDSDLDFVVEFEPNCDDVFDSKHRLRMYLEQLFAEEIDIANYKFLKSYAKSLIDSEVCIVR